MTNPTLRQKIQLPWAAESSLDAVYHFPDQADKSVTEPIALLVLAHGAGANYLHRNMENLAAGFAGEGVATLRFNFPFMQAGKRRVDSQSVAMQALAIAVARAQTDYPGLPIWLGGHSFGGRMASHFVLDAPYQALVNKLCGLVFCSFPLHGAKKPSTQRAQHLPDVALPMLFLSGTRDALATDTLLNEVLDPIANAQLHWLHTANHSYDVLKRQRPATAECVFAEIGRVTKMFIQASRKVRT